VSPATFRHPSNLAKLVTTADHVSGGRVEVGLGAGWHEREHEAYGFRFPKTRTRVDVLEEQLVVLLGNWSDGPFSFEGHHYRVQDLEAQPKPIQRPHPPLILGGAAGRRSAALAARFADEYNTAFPTLGDARARKARIDDACEKVGRAPIRFSIMTTVIAGADSADLDERIARVAAKQGIEVEGLRQERPQSWIVGTTEQVGEQLLSLRESGVSRVMCQHLAHEDLEHVALLGRELGPRLK
jgi:alkanesulfonate monooxygenase SsuD/methylene tetrahydromethanopterin reductase-like flavin-dependent oxidoreductase (luciferase family)